MNEYVLSVFTGILGIALGIVATRLASRRLRNRKPAFGPADFESRRTQRELFCGWHANAIWTCVCISMEECMHAGIVRIALLENARGERIRLKCRKNFVEGDKAILVPLTDDQLRSGYWISLADEAVRIVRLTRDLGELMEEEPSLSGYRLTVLLREAGLTPDEASAALYDKGFTVQREEQPWGTILHVSSRPTKGAMETAGALMGGSSEVAWHHQRSAA